MTAPFRHFLNNHFEMVKAEVRASGGTDTAAIERLTQHVDHANATMQGAAASFVVATGETQQLFGRQLAEIGQHTRLSTEVGERVLGELTALEASRRTIADQIDVELQLLRHARLEVSDIASLAGQQQAAQADLIQRLDDLALRPVPARYEEVGVRDAALANRMTAHDGYLSQAGVWVNEPLSVGFEDGRLGLHDVNERICEIPYVMAAMGQLARGSRVIDIGCCESVVSLSLASLGHRVTALDPRPYPFGHPLLRVETKPIEEFTADEPFAAAILLSTIEHLGVGWYGLETGGRLDLRAMAHIRTLLAPTGLIVLTTPFGRAGETELERTYDVAGIRELTSGFSLMDEPLVMVRNTRTEWTPDPRGFVDVVDDRQRVVMLTARPSAA